MTLEEVRAFLGWCSVLNIGILLFWFLGLVVAKDFVYATHNKWFKISRETFDVIHFSGMAFFKIAIWVFNLVPYIALRIVG
jgi:hypothetical protein